MDSHTNTHTRTQIQCSYQAQTEVFTEGLWKLSDVWNRCADHWQCEKEEECIRQRRWKWEKWCGRAERAWIQFWRELPRIHYPETYGLNGQHGFFSLWIPFFPFIPILPLSLFVIFFLSITALARLPHKGLLLACWLYKQLKQLCNMPPPHLCVLTTRSPAKLSARPSRDIPALQRLPACSLFHNRPTGWGSNSCSGHISLSVPCKHCAHLQMSAWSATLCVYTSGMWRHAGGSSIVNTS